MNTKVCKKCGTEQPIDAFHRNKNMADGHLNACRRCAGAFNRKYRKNYKLPPGQRRANRQAYGRRHPEKVLARDAVYIAKKRGRIVAGPCEVCGATNAEAHHDDYSKPLDVRWLCREHHREHHAKATTQPQGEHRGIS